MKQYDTSIAGVFRDGHYFVQSRADQSNLFEVFRTRTATQRRSDTEVIDFTAEPGLHGV
jgi:hypothetical protein